MDNRDENKKDNKNKKQLSIAISILSIVLVILIGISIYFLVFDKSGEEQKLAYTDLIKKVADNEVEKVEMRVGSTNVKVKLKDEEKEKTTIVPNTQAFIELIQEKVEQGNAIELIQNPQNMVVTISQTLFSLLPTILLIALFVLVFKMQGLGEKGKVYDADATKEKVKFDDVAGLDEEKQEMIEIVQFLKEPKKFYEMGAKIPRGVLLYGKPGTGKTLIAKAIAGEAGVPFISMSGSEFIEMFAGLGASRVRKLFEKARKVAPCIVFIDEIDAIGSRRASGNGAESENNQTLNQLLVEMDGFDTEETIIVLAATNRPEMLDKALLRPGRFDRQITISVPDLRGREAILKIHAKDKKFAEDVNLKSIAEDTAGFTGAELANILNEAAIIATINEHEAIDYTDLEEAVKKVTVGLQKTSRVISEKDKKLTAYHEAGHAIVSRYLESQEPVKEISIIPRGMAGGYTMYKTNEDKNYISKTEMKERLIGLLGGRAAEKIALNDISTGASNDIEVATKIAKDMVTVYGMSDVIGTISINTEKDPYELELLGDKFGDAIGAEVKLLLDEAYRSAQTILANHMDKLHEVAQTLLKQEVISQEEFEKFFLSNRDVL
ncbi:MAG: ATP-dependent zinc metalloprotease FtsH [Clostridia bacterium]